MSYALAARQLDRYVTIAQGRELSVLVGKGEEL